MATGFVFRDKTRYVVLDRDGADRLLYEVDLTTTIPTPNFASALSREFRSVSAGEVMIRLKITGAVGGVSYSLNNSTVLGTFSSQGGDIAYLTARIDSNSGYNTLYLWSTSEVATLHEIEIVSLEGLSTTEITPPQDANGLLDLKTYPSAGSPNGLYLNDEKIGFWNGTLVKYMAYMASSGDFELGDHLELESNFLYWNSSNGVLELGGKISAREGDIAGWIIDTAAIHKDRVFLDSVLPGLRIVDIANIDNSVEIGDIVLKDLTVPAANLLTSLNPGFESDLTEWSASVLEQSADHAVTVFVSAGNAYEGTKAFKVQVVKTMTAGMQENSG